jgi:hypothetical protein
MPTYIYETVPADASTPVARFELQQKMSEAPLTAHPQTGEPIQRVIMGGMGFMKAREGVPASAPVAQHSGPMRCGSGSCGCH